MIKITFKYLLLIFFALCAKHSFSQDKSTTVLWKNGNGNYNIYRIPALIKSNRGTLLAFCEGREAIGDDGNIDLLVKRSSDNGKTWSKEQVVWNDQNNTCGNPCPVVDVATGRIWLFMTWSLGNDYEATLINKTSSDTRRPFLCYSDDDGNTWSEPKDMSANCRETSWGWYATGPGVGIQLRSDEFKGRLIIPANHSYDDPNGTLNDGPYGYGTHVLISDDAGNTWRKSHSILPGCNESQVVELSDGSLLINMRSYNNKHSRAIATSKDGGETWSEIYHDPQLVESRCQASLIKYGEYNGQDMYLFSNPAVPFGRTHMTIKVSFDNCSNWSNSKLINQGSSIYSCMAKLGNGDVGILYEQGDGDEFENIIFTRIPVAELFNPGTLLKQTP